MALQLECLPLHADTLLRSLVSTANRYELEQMASQRGMAVLGMSDDELRARLLALAGDAGEGEDSQREAGEHSYQMRIENAERMRKVGDGSLVTLVGDVRAMIRISQDTSGKEKELDADKVIVDADHTLFSAMGGVVYTDLDPDAAVQGMLGDIITFDWQDSLLKITGGMTETERTNSKDEKVEFYTKGDEITYDTNQGLIFFRHGSITNNPVHSYSSITASKLAVMDNGDMFIENAYLSIGRVPVLWLPFFVFPGSRMLGNPAIGIESDRGWFVNTTFEFYGTYPGVSNGSSSSFTRLLETDDGAVKVLDGSVYRSLGQGESLGRFQQWARDSGSYMVLIADSYQNSGLVGGLVTENNLWGKRLSLKFDGRIATTTTGKDTLTSYSSYPKTRYLVESEVALKTQTLSLTLSMPLYSDPKVKRAYTNRFTSFSMDHLWGADWPTTYSSEVTTYTWKASGTFKLPAWWDNNLLKNLSVTTAEASATYKWLRDSDSNTYGYVLNSVTLPSLKATMGGTIFSFSEEGTNVPATKTQVEQEEEAEHVRKASEVSADPLVNAMLESAFKAHSSTSTTTKKPRSVALTYSLSENLTQTGSSQNNTFDWEDTRYRYNQTKGSLLFDSVADGNWFTFSEELDPSYTSTYDASKSTRKTKDFTLSSTTKSAIPIIGLSYTLTQKLYTYSETTTYSSATDTEATTSETTRGAFNKRTVTTHQMALSKSFTLPKGTLTPTMTWVLPPLTQSVTPSVTYKAGPWTLSGSFKFSAQEEGGPLERDLGTLSVGLDTRFLTASVKGTYQTQEYKADEFWYPFASIGSAALRLFGWTFSGSYDYQNDNDSYGMHYFNSLSTGLAWGPVKTTWSWNGPRDELERYTWITIVDLANGKLVWWKRRVTFSCDLGSTMTVNYQDRYATNLSFKISLGFSIAEFLDVKFSMASSNTSFFTYYENDTFQWKEMWQDLARSFDVFGGGIRQTNFNLSSLGLEIIHSMDDWTLNCKYTGSVVLSDHKYSWVPVISVFLQWKTLPELKVDENWTRKSNDSAWQETSSVYSD